jgi:hypothetical protein
LGSDKFITGSACTLEIASSGDLVASFMKATLHGGMANVWPFGANQIRRVLLAEKFSAMKFMGVYRLRFVMFTAIFSF